MIRFSCPECETALKVADEKAGGKIACPSCKTSVKVPAGERKDKEESRVRAGKAATVAAARRRDDDYDDEDELPPAKSKKKSSAGLLIGIGVGAFLLVGVGVAAVVLTNKKPADTPQAAASPPPAASGLPTPGGGAATPGGGAAPAPTPGSAAPNLGSSSTKPPETPAKVEPAKTADAGGGEQIVLGQGGENIYDRLLKSAVLIFEIKGTGSSMGSGTLVDKERKLVLTNYHVSGDGDSTIIVYFPEYSKKELIAPRKHYKDKLMSGVGIPGMVVAKHPKKDLALIKLTNLPEGVQPLPLAKVSAKPGQSVHSIGNPGVSDACWVYTSGTVRAVLRMQFVAGGGDGSIYEIDAQVVQTQSPINGGDSGGPLVNDLSELVGVTQSTRNTGNLTSNFIDVSEARNVINLYYKSIGANRELEAVALGVKANDIAGILKLLREEEDSKRRARAALALGQLGPEAKSAVPDLVIALKDKDETVRRKAAEALDSIGSLNRNHVAALMAALKDNDADVRTFVASALVKMGLEAKAAVPALAESATKDNDAIVRLRCAQALGRIGPDAKDAVGALTEALKDNEVDVQSGAAAALGRIGPSAKSAVPALGAALKNSNKELRLNVLAALSGLGPEAKAAVPALSALLSNKEADIRTETLNTLGAIGPDASGAMRNIIALFEEQDPLHTTAVETAAKIGKAAVPALIKALMNNALGIRLGAAESLGQIGPDASEALGALKGRSKDKFLEVQAAAAKAIKRIQAK